MEATDEIVQPIDDIPTTDGVCDWFDVANARDEVRRRLTAALAVAPKQRVKALEWYEEEIPPTGEYLAYSAVGLYCIPRGRSAFSVRFRDKYEDGPYPTLDAAKAAAQADYERRILAALED